MPRKSPRKSTPRRIRPDRCNETKQLIFMLPDKIIETKSDDNVSLVQLKHPRTGKGTLYLFDHNNSTYEILKYEEKPKSWFLGNSVEQDGTLHVCTELNTLFLVLPYFLKVDKFVLLDQVLQDDEYPEIKRLINCVKDEKLDLITDSKKHGSGKVYKFNKAKTLEWLKKRVEKLAIVLEEENVHVTKGARSATFVRSKREEMPEKSDYLKYACGLISEYLDHSLSRDLHQHLNVEMKNEVPTDSIEPPAKRAKIEKLPEPKEDYSDGKNVPKSKPQLKKLSNMQKKLEKVDKTGMKTLSSFFAKRK